jgi:predicted Zn-dependent peptidase
MKPLMIMNRVSGVLVFALLVAAAVPAQTLKLPPHERVVLKNGLTLLLVEKHGVPIVSFSAIVKSGSASDPAGQHGVASITSGLLRKGTQKRTAQQFSADLDFIGGSFDAGVDSDFTSISAEFLTKDLDRGLDLFSDALLHASFPQAEVDKLLAQTLDGVKASKDQPDAVLGTYYTAYLCGTHPYGRPGGGDEVSLAKIKRDAISKFYEANYTPGNTIVAIAGEFSAAVLKKKLEGTLGAWPEKTAPVTSIAELAPVKGKRLLLIDKPDASQTYFAIGNVGVSATDPDRVAIRVVNTIFGGRFTSLLNEALRVESGYTYGAESFFQPQKVAGPFGIFSFTKNETTIPAIDLALKTLVEFHKNGVTADQLTSAKNYIKGQFPPSIETSGQLARRIASNEFYGLDDNEINQLEARIDAVTLGTAKQVIEKHFPKDNLVFVLIGKSSEIAPAVKKYAEKQDARKISEPGFWPPAN